jgi:hypothetical protein
MARASSRTDETEYPSVGCTHRRRDRARVRAIASADDAHHRTNSPVVHVGRCRAGGRVRRRDVGAASRRQYFASHLQSKYAQQNKFFQTTATGFRTIAEPGAFIIGGTLYIAGRASKQRDMADLDLRHRGDPRRRLFANALKYLFGRARPFVKPPTSTGFDANDWQIGRGLKGDSYRSFPSGHTVAAFAAASRL